MSILERYIQKSLLQYIVIVVFFIIAIDLLFSFTREFSLITNDIKGWANLTLYLLMTIPRRIYKIFPIAALLGTLIGLTALSSRKELMVMRAAGLAISKITLIVLKLILVLVICVAVMGEWFVPRIEQAALGIKAIMRGNGQALVTEHGIWLRDTKNFIYINKLLPHGKMLDITMYEFNSSAELQQVRRAQSADFSESKWFLHDINTTSFKNGEITNSFKTESAWTSHIKPELLGVLDYDPQDLSLRRLSNYIFFLENNDLDVRPYLLAFWKKIAQPVVTLVMVFLAIPFVFSTVVRNTTSRKVIFGALIGFSFYIINEITGPLSTVYDISPILVAFAPTILFTLAGIYLVTRAY